MTISSEALLAMENHASSSDSEVCGLVFEHGYVRLENVSGDSHRFYGDPSQLAKTLSVHGEPLAIFHTHPNGNLTLSEEDRKMWYYRGSTMIVGCMQNGRLRWKMYGNRGD